MKREKIKSEHYYRLRDIARLKNPRPKLLEFLGEVEPKKQRTESQNNALHKFYSMLAEELNEKGKDMRVVLKPSWSIWWTTESIKSYIWKPIMKAMTGKESTTELEKNSGEIDKIHEMIMKNLGENFHIEYIPFPHLEEGEKDSKGKIK